MRRKLSEKPNNRSNLRLKLGSKYFTYKRYIRWIFTGMKFAKRRDEELPFICFSHQTPLLRRLKDVEMYLQYNKITNLRIAVPKVNQVTLRPGETISWG